MKVTKENFDLYLDLKEVFEDKIESVLKDMCMIKTGRSYAGDDITKITYSFDTIEVETTYYRGCGCCPDETEYYEIPVSYLFDDSWKINLENEIKTEREWEEKRKEDEAKKRKLEKEQREKEEFERLKSKFEPKVEKKLKYFLIVYYNRFANQTQTFKVEAENAFRAGRLFYKKYNRKAYHSCIEIIEEC